MHINDEMKRRFLILTTLVFPVLLISCHREMESVVKQPIVEYDVINPNSVTLADIQNYVQKDIPVIKSGGVKDYTVEVYKNNSDTLMYIVNYGDGDGWRVLSGDMRTPAVIAKSDSN